MGRSRIRTPVASWTALAIAAAMGTMAGMPAPVDGVFGSPISATSISGASVIAPLMSFDGPFDKLRTYSG